MSYVVLIMSTINGVSGHLFWIGLGSDARQLVKCQDGGKYGYDNVGMILAHE